MSALIADRFHRYGAEGAAPADRDRLGSSATIARQFVDGGAGQLHLRHGGDRAAPALLLLHDAPGSSEQAEPVIAALAERFFVVAPDLPGNGESDAFPGSPTMGDHAAAMVGLLDALGVETAAVLGLGFGATAALALADAQPARVQAVAVAGLALPDEVECADWRSRYAPPIAIEPDGAHWYRTWLMLRDSQIWFPWYDRRVAALRRVSSDFTARPLHRWTMDVMRASCSYAMVIAAALDVDAPALLHRLRVPLILVRDRARPLSAHDDRLAPVRQPDAVLDATSPDFACQLYDAVMTDAHTDGSNRV